MSNNRFMFLADDYIPDQKKIEKKTDKKIYYISKIKKLDENSFNLNAKVYYYIKNLFNELILTNNKSEIEVIKEIFSIGKSRIDKIIVIGNLFYLAVRKDKLNLMQIIVSRITEEECKIIVNSFDHNYTPLMHAAYNGQVGAVKLLLIWGANSNIINKDNEDIYMCIENGLKNSVEKNKSLELLIKCRYDEINEYISS